MLKFVKGSPSIFITATGVGDDVLLGIGTGNDGVLVLSSAGVGADTALTNVLIGTPESQAIAANSLMISNVTASGDIAMYVNKGGNSQMVFFADGSTGDTAIMAATGQSVDAYIAGVKVVDIAANGVVIDQAALDTAILSFRSSDVATGLTTGTNIVDVTTTDYGALSKFAAVTGGLLVQALGENAAVTTNLLFESYGGQADTTKSSAGRALIEVYAAQHNGANVLAAVAANGNIFAIRGHTVNTVWLADEDGDVWQAGGITVGGDIITDHWLNSLNNTILGSGVMGAGNLTHSAGEEGWYNTAVGNFNLFSNNTGSHDTALGYASLYSNTTGSANTAVGYTSLYLNTTGSNNSSLGYFSLYGNSTGAQNLALGFEAGYGATPANASVADTNMVFIGYRANRSVASATALTDSIAIGAGALVDVSHQAVLGHTTITTTRLRGAVTVGVAGTQQGSIALSGITSGLVTIAVDAAAGTTTFNVTQRTGTAVVNAAYGTGDLDTEAEIIAAINANGTAINLIRAALNASGLTTTV